MLTTHVASQGLAEELKRSGWPQEGSTFVWIKTKHAKGIYFVTEAIKSLLTMPDTEWCALPLASELMEKLENNFDLFYGGRLWYAKEPVGDEQFTDENVCDVLAKLALHLIQENKLNLE